MDVVTMFNDCFNLKIGWMVSMYIPMVPLGFDMAYPAELQGLCDSDSAGKPKKCHCCRIVTLTGVTVTDRACIYCSAKRKFDIFPASVRPKKIFCRNPETVRMGCKMP